MVAIYPYHPVVRGTWRVILAAALVTGLAGIGPAVDAADGVADPQRPGVPEVVGGSAARPGQFPWMVRLSIGCGGTLIAPRAVLTAAHCIPRSGPTRSIVVSANSVVLNSRGAVRVRSTYVKRAPRFRSATRGDDWAVVRLERPLDLPTVRPARDRSYDRGSFVVLGWGAVREGGSLQRRLRTASVPFVDDRTCEKAYESAGYRFLKREMICAGNFRRGGVDSCQGDSGGPLMRRDRAGRWVQVGIVSWGHGCARPRYPGVYTQLSAYADEIADAVRAG
jgi:secreted trypsin-like serine protease